MVMMGTQKPEDRNYVPIAGRAYLDLGSFSISPTPYNTDNGKMISPVGLEVLSSIEELAKKTREDTPAVEEVIVNYQDKEGNHHRGTQKAIDALRQNDTITPQAAGTLKQFVEAFKGKISPDVEEKLKQKGIRRV